MATEGTGAKAARDLGQGWKISPSVRIKPKTTFTMAEITGPGAIQQIWMTPTGPWRYLILRFYWDGETTPSVEVPVGDFFACGWGGYAQISSLAVCVNPGSAFNCYWEMPFRKGCRITVENLGDDGDDALLPDQLHAHRGAGGRRLLPRPVPPREPAARQGGLHDPRRRAGQGHYVGTYLAWGVHSTGWWGEGEIKFYLDGDKEFPTICGTGTEDYFCGSYNFENQATKRYQEFTTPYSGLAQVHPAGRALRARSSGSASTAGTSWTRSASRRTCG